jgi:hypothetical protein
VRREAQPAADAEPIEVRGTNVAAQVAAGAGAHEPPIELDDDDDEVEDQILAQAMAAMAGGGDYDDGLKRAMRASLAVRLPLDWHSAAAAGSLRRGWFLFCGELVRTEASRDDGTS